MKSLLPIAIVLALATAYGLWYQRSRGKVVVKSDKGLITQEMIGAPLGARVTLVQFSSAFCSPCRATRMLLEDVTAEMSDVAYVEIDAEANDVRYDSDGVAGIDGRFKVAVPVYGCGYLGDNSVWADTSLAAMSPEARDLWLQYLPADHAEGAAALEKGAARVTLERRGDASTGWSMAWIYETRVRFA